MTSQFSLKITQASLNQTALDWPQNMANHFEAIDAAVAQRSDMLLMPELSLTGYEVNDDFQRTDNGRIFQALEAIADYARKKDRHLLVSVGHPWRVQLREAFDKPGSTPDLERAKNALYDRLSQPFNVHSLLMDGKVVSMTAKAHLFRDERGYENRYFNEWSSRDARHWARLSGRECHYGTIDITLPDGSIVPFGRPIVHVGDEQGHSYIHAKIICEEKWIGSRYDGYPHDDSRYSQLNPVSALSHYLGSGSGVLLEIADASPPARLKIDRHIHLNNLASGYVDVVVDTDGLGTSGSTFAQCGHRLISQNGALISSGRRLSFARVATTTSVVKIDRACPSMQANAHVSLRKRFTATESTPSTQLHWDSDDGDWDRPDNAQRWKEEQIRCQALWMFDYLRKTRAGGIAEALSGGKDSSFNCTMVRVMVELAMSELGVAGFCRQMKHLSYIDKILEGYTHSHEAAVCACMREMLTAVYMATQNSSEQTRYAAKTLIDGTDGIAGIGGSYMERNIQDLVSILAITYGMQGLNDGNILTQAQMAEEVAAFVHASPYEYSPLQMQRWADTIQTRYPQLERLTSAALPGHEVAYENLQARAREVLIMALANVEGKMAVANPNLDEAYGAYATFGGDLHSGTVNWNAGIHKADQETLMRYLMEVGLPGVLVPLKSLGPAIDNRATAELQPKKNGQVAQHDEQALQGTFVQKAVLSRLRHRQKVNTEQGERWMNAGEVFEHARDHDAFAELDDNRLFNAVAYFYHRWEGPAQHKIHASPIAPTYGENVDHQTSLRTPNLSGGSRDEIVQLGLKLLVSWAQDEGVAWDQAQVDTLNQRAWLDEAFVERFISLLRCPDNAVEDMSFNLGGLYSMVKARGWSGVFPEDDR